MKKLYYIGIFCFIFLLSIYFIYGNRGYFFTQYYFILHNLFYGFLIYYIIKISKNRGIRIFSRWILGFVGLKTIYEIVLCTKKGWDYLQTIESELWSIIFIIYLMIVIYFMIMYYERTGT